MKGNGEYFTMFGQLLADQTAAITMAAKVREHILTSNEDIQHNKKTKNIISDSGRKIKEVLNERK
jgi:hypothetical protein